MKSPIDIKEKIMELHIEFAECQEADQYFNMAFRDLEMKMLKWVLEDE